MVQWVAERTACRYAMPTSAVAPHTKRSNAALKEVSYSTVYCTLTDAASMDGKPC